MSAAVARVFAAEWEEGIFEFIFTIGVYTRLITMFRHLHDAAASERLRCVLTMLASRLTTNATVVVFVAEAATTVGEAGRFANRRKAAAHSARLAHASAIGRRSKPSCIARTGAPQQFTYAGVAKRSLGGTVLLVTQPLIKTSRTHDRFVRSYVLMRVGVEALHPTTVAAARILPLPKWIATGCHDGSGNKVFDLLRDTAKTQLHQVQCDGCCLAGTIAL